MSPPTLVDVLFSQLDDHALDALADLLAPRLTARLQAESGPGPWLDARGAAEYLSTSRERVYDLVQLRKLSPRRDGRRLLFHRDELDRYVSGSA